MVKAVFAGSFDPPTNGHLDIIQRASEIFDCIDVVIAVNPRKNYLFSEEERLSMMGSLIADYRNVELHICREIIVNYAKRVGAKVLVRGIRTVNDFSYEFDLALMNQSLNSDIETLFLPTKERYFTVKSSSIKELAQFGGDISRMVPPVVASALAGKYAER